MMVINMKEKACRMCHKVITDKTQCPDCKTYTLSDDFTGIVWIFSLDDNQIATRLNITKAGKYALKVR
jgi:DNA-directed RNA polymerase subunit E"